MFNFIKDWFAPKSRVAKCDFLRARLRELKKHPHQPLVEDEIKAIYKYLRRHEVPVVRIKTILEIS